MNPIQSSTLQVPGLWAGASAATASVRVCFIPYYDDNPYQRELARALRPYGVEVSARRGVKWLLRVPLGGREKPDIVHLHWLPPFRRNPVGVLRFLAFFARAGFLHALGCRIVWTVHNLQHHEATWRKVELFFSRMVVAMSSRVIVHSPIAGQLVTAEFGAHAQRKLAVVPHGNYIGVYPNVVSRGEARERLGLQPHTTVLLFLGYLRPYKGLNELIRAFRQVDEPDYALVIAGSPFDDRAVDQLRAESEGDARIHLRPGFVPDDDIQVYMNAADAVVFPYQAILTSGAVVLAMSFGRACVAPRLGCIPDVLNEDGAALYDRSEPDGLRGALQRILQRRDELPGMGAYNLARARQWGWNTVARETAGAYAAALNGHPPKAADATDGRA
ncbi:MAG TPA: glycosyltransferase family 4 protein [Opitutaceae bacterium]